MLPVIGVQSNRILSQFSFTHAANIARTQYRADSGLKSPGNVMRR